MIVSASCRTDIPAFYGRWFMNRLDAGFCRAANPFGGQPYTVSLAPADVDGFVFCTKNIGPFMKDLLEVRERGFPFTVQYTINGYPRELEPRVPSIERTTGHMREMARAYGPRVCVWRYDTIVMSSITDAAWHLENFRRIAGRLEGATDEVIVSFAQLYKKTVRNLDRAAGAGGFTWWDPPADEKKKLLRSLSAIAAEHGMALKVCGQRELLTDGVRDAICIDPFRLSDVAGREIFARPRSHRKTCSCFEAKDVGAYDTCLHGCVYCYGVNSRRAALARYRAHDPEAEALSAPLSVPPSGPSCELFISLPGTGRLERRAPLGELLSDRDGAGATPCDPKKAC